MAKVPVHLRLEEALIRRIDEYAASRLSNRTAVVQQACLGFLEDAGAGVPDLPSSAERPVERAERSVPAPAEPNEGRRLRARQVPGVRFGSEVTGRPARAQFESGEAWQQALRAWKEQHG